jgi:hypothetical protein
MSTSPAARGAELPRDPSLPFVPCRMFDGTWFDRAPVRFDNSVVLPVSKARLFEVFADPHSWSRWATGIGAVDWTSPAPFGPGTTRTVTFWGGVKVYEQFFAYDPDAGHMAFCFYGTSEPIWTSFGENYRVTELSSDSCRLDWTVAYDPTGVFGRIHWLVAPVMRFNLASYMWRLRGYLGRLDAKPALTAAGNES